MFLNSFPVSGWVRIDGGTLEYGRGCSVGERAVDDIPRGDIQNGIEKIRDDNVRVPSNPTNIGHACKLVVWVDIEHVFDSQGSTEKVPARRMNDTVRFPC